uniref:Uncharacterized protein n=1 Tax=Yersinia ruckeri TaxID=29486 RepID=A0A0A8VIT6_YERRU|nr:hypothetical protein CSF007_12545 [Yersinia ruckeri]
MRFGGIGAQQLVRKVSKNVAVTQGSTSFLSTVANQYGLMSNINGLFLRTI